MTDAVNKVEQSREPTRRDFLYICTVATYWIVVTLVWRVGSPHAILRRRYGCPSQ